MLGATGAVDNPDVYAECDVALKAGPEARPTQPPHPQRIADVLTGDSVDLELYGSPDTVNIKDNLSVDVTPLSSISTSGQDMSVVESVSADRGTLMSVDFDDRMREIQNVEIADTAAIVGARRSSGDPSHYKRLYFARSYLWCVCSAGKLRFQLCWFGGVRICVLVVVCTYLSLLGMLLFGGE